MFNLVLNKEGFKGQLLCGDQLLDTAIKSKKTTVSKPKQLWKPKYIHGRKSISEPVCKEDNEPKSHPLKAKIHYMVNHI